MQEQAISFLQGQYHLEGILHHPQGLLRGAVIVVVGGPQTRVGSHRQFVLLARALAAAGFAVLRFDYRGMGDSDGDAIDFRQCGPDIRAAIDALQRHYPSVQRVTLWGLCDAASATLLYAHRDSRVARLILLNPWVRTARGEAEVMLRHYYLKRLMSKQFWLKLLHRRVALVRALGELWQRWRRRAPAGGTEKADPAEDYVNGMLRGLQQFDGEVLLILSGDDLTAAEFEQLPRSSQAWRHALAREGLCRRRLAEANHTFSTARWRRQVECWTLDWLCGELPGEQASGSR